ncbi:SET and MYND domain-containing protein 4, partial [Pseudolycoriella hygida]
ESEFKVCKDGLERVQLIKKLFHWIPVPDYYFQRFEKSNDISFKLREKANLAYKNGNFNLALRGYNLAVMFASTDGEELGLAYGNRSALFVQMKNPYSALRDIDLALSCSYAEHLKKKLLDRKKKCNSFILQEKRESLKTQERKQRGKNYCNENFLRLKTHNPSISNAEEFVSIEYTKERGRRLVVNRQVSPGKRFEEKT